MRNLLTQLKEILGSPPLLVGTVAAVDGEIVKVQLPGTGVVSARGSAQLGDKVYVRDGVIEGPAPDLPIHTIEV